VCNHRHYVEIDEKWTVSVDHSEGDVLRSVDNFAAMTLHLRA
jgi:hypothetical protein